MTTELRDISARVSAAHRATGEAYAKLEDDREALLKAGGTPGSPEHRRYEQSHREYNAKAVELGELRAERDRMFGGGGRLAPRGNGPGSTDDVAGGDGWTVAARTLDLGRGRNRVEVDAASLLQRPMAAVGVTPGSGLTAPTTHAAFTPLGQDRRFLYPVFGIVELGEGEMAISDFTQTGSRKAATIAAATDAVTATAHGFANGERVVFVALTGGAGLTVGTTYFVRDATASTFKVAATSGGAAVDVTTDATAAKVINLETVGRTVTGSVERDPVATTEKAKLDLGVELATDPVRQFAAVVDKVPAKLFEIESAFEAFLRSELLYQLERAIDAHTITRILAAAPLAGNVGTDLIARTRNAIATLREVGANPTVLAIGPPDAATLDLTRTTDGAYIFLTREAGAASPLWSLAVVEVAGLTSPIVIDPARLGVLYLAGGRVLADPFTGLTTNEVRVRVELDALMHVRDANGAYVIT